MSVVDSSDMRGGHHNELQSGYTQDGEEIAGRYPHCEVVIGVEIRTFTIGGTKGKNN